MAFSLISGVFIPDVSPILKEYRPKKDGFIMSLSGDDYGRFFHDALRLLPEPIFFFIETPSDNDGSRTYYLDNCTRPVAQAILKRYGGILYNDGVIRWGFGSHKTEEEVYMQDYQTVSGYAKSRELKNLPKNLGYKENPSAKLTWDIISAENPGECVNVESDGETYEEMVSNLTEVGMYADE